MKGIETLGVIVAQHRNCFEVRIDQGPIVSAVESGRIRKANIWLTLGDRVTVELSPYEMPKGRITRRL